MLRSETLVSSLHRSIERYFSSSVQLRSIQSARKHIKKASRFSVKNVELDDSLYVTVEDPVVEAIRFAEEKERTRRKSKKFIRPSSVSSDYSLDEARRPDKRLDPESDQSTSSTGFYDDLDGPFDFEFIFEKRSPSFLSGLTFLKNLNQTPTQLTELKPLKSASERLIELARSSSLDATDSAELLRQVIENLEICSPSTLALVLWSSCRLGLSICHDDLGKIIDGLLQDPLNSLSQKELATATYCAWKLQKNQSESLLFKMRKLIKACDSVQLNEFEKEAVAKVGKKLGFSLSGI